MDLRALTPSPAATKRVGCVVDVYYEYTRYAGVPRAFLVPGTLVSAAEALESEYAHFFVLGMVIGVYPRPYRCMMVAGAGSGEK